MLGLWSDLTILEVFSSPNDSGRDARAGLSYQQPHHSHAALGLVAQAGGDPTWKLVSQPLFGENKQNQKPHFLYKPKTQYISQWDQHLQSHMSTIPSR